MIFGTFVGYMASAVVGALLMTIGFFLPAFSFTLLGHELLQKLVTYRGLVDVLAGITAAVVGFMGITAWELLEAAATDPAAACVFVVALLALYRFRHGLTSTAVVLCGALAGQALYA